MTFPSLPAISVPPSLSILTKGYAPHRAYAWADEWINSRAAFCVLASTSVFNDFLYAPIGEQENGMVLTVLSALARLGVDPWDEAARLSELPQENAKKRLTSIILGLPDGLRAKASAADIAARLGALLPGKQVVPVAQPVMLHAKQLPPSAVLMFLFLFGECGGVLRRAGLRASLDWGPEHLHEFNRGSAASVFAMNIWKAIERVNRGCDDWLKNAFDKMITSVDHPDRRHAMQHLNVRDLLAKGLGAGKNPE